MKRDYKLFIQDIIDSISQIQEYVKNHTLNGMACHEFGS